MNEDSVRIFEKLSGWTEKSKYQGDHSGYITVEEDIMTGEAHAFLWRYDKDPVHLQYMHMGDHEFVKP